MVPPQPQPEQSQAPQSAAPPAPLRSPRRQGLWLWRAAGGLAAALLTLPLAAAVALWWWSGTEGSLADALQWLQRSQPLVAQDVTGSLRTGGRIGRLAWSQDGLDVQADAVALSWQPLALLSGTLRLDSLSAGSVRIEDRRTAPATPSGPPSSVALPVAVTLADFSVDRLQWIGPPAFEATGIAGDYRYQSSSHALNLRSLQAAGGSYRGTATLQAQGDLALDAAVSGMLQTALPGSTATLPLAFQATLQGPIAALGAHASLQARPAGALRGAAPSQATASARITPWEQQPVAQAQASFRDLDVGAFWPQAPRTRLTGTASVRPVTGVTASWQLQAELANTLAGPWDGQRLPLEQLEAAGEWRGGTVLVRKLNARVGGGELRAEGKWTGDGDGTNKAATGRGWEGKATLRQVDPAALHSALAGPRVSGQAEAQGIGAAFSFDTQLQAAPGAGKRTAPEIAALGLRDAKASGRWDDGRLSLHLLQVRTRDAGLDAALELRLDARTGSGRVTLSAPGLNLSVRGDLAENAGQGDLALQGRDAAQALRWLQRLPGAPAALQGAAASGSGDLQTRWQGGWRDPELRATLDVPLLEWRAGPDAGPLRVKTLQATLSGRLSQARLALQGKLDEGSRHHALQLALQGSRTGALNAPLSASAWQAEITQLDASVQDDTLGPGVWRVATRAAVMARWTPVPGGGALDIGAGEATLTPPARMGATGAANAAAAAGPGGAAGTAANTATAQVAWQPIRWQPGRLVSAGRITGLPLAWIELFGGAQLAGAGLAGDLIFDGQWDATLTETLRLRATLMRRSGDISVLAETAPGVSTRVAAGVRDASLTLSNDGDRLQLALRWDSERAGTADGQLATRLATSGSGWQWAADAPLEGRLRARLPRIGLWSVLAPPGWRLRGSLDADLAVAGTRAAPRLGGTLRADDLALRSVADGIEFGDGRLRMRLDGTRLLIDEFLLKGAQGAGDKGAGGTLTARGEAGWASGQPQVRLTARLERLRASIRTDRQLTVSGDLRGRYEPAGAAIEGRLRIDQASILLPDQDTPRLGDDVVVRRGTAVASGAKAPAQATATAAATAPRPTALALAVQVDLGDDFRVQGRGLETRLRGVLDIAGASLAAPRLTGTVSTSGGQYRAYGQRLDVEQGLLRFTGALDNPSLDILAVRPNMTQRVGVQITGSALLPRVRLYAQPDMPDAEKLSWLVIGRASASGGAEAALLQQAALALLGGSGGGLSGGLAASLGLDELSYRGAAGGNDTASAGVVTLGKRFSRNFYVAYERSLAGTLGTFYVFYDLSRRVTVRAQAGQQSAIDLIFTLQYE